jgi:hypothetical protein
MSIKFVTGEPALKIGKALVMADLHLGAEHDYRSAGISMPSRTSELENKIEMLMHKTRAKRLIILGDVKHRVPGSSFQEEREVPQLLSRLSSNVSVEVVPGNHDGGLEKMCPNITMHPSEGMVLHGGGYGHGNDRGCGRPVGGGRQGFWLCHGHAWPAEEALTAEAMVIGHNHPQVEFRDRLGKVWRERVWVKARITPKALKMHYKKLPKRLPDLILMPAFSELVGGWAVNRPDDKGKLVGGLGPITRCASIGKGLVYLLDGTFLGKIEDI